MIKSAKANNHKQIRNSSKDYNRGIRKRLTLSKETRNTTNISILYQNYTNIENMKKAKLDKQNQTKNRPKSQYCTINNSSIHFEF